MAKSYLNVGYVIIDISETDCGRHCEFIERKLESLFPGSYKLMASGREGQKEERVYRIESPILGGITQVAFFRSLKELFDETKDFSPHFCDFVERKKDD